MTSSLEQAPNPHCPASGAARRPGSCQGRHSVPSCKPPVLATEGFVRSSSQYGCQSNPGLLLGAETTPALLAPGRQPARPLPSIALRSSPRALGPHPHPFPFGAPSPFPLPSGRGGTSTFPVSAPAGRGDGGLAGRAGPAPRSRSVRRESRRNRPTAAGGLAAGHRPGGPQLRGSGGKVRGTAGGPAGRWTRARGSPGPGGSPAAPRPTPVRAPLGRRGFPARPGASSARTPPGPGPPLPADGPLPSPAAAAPTAARAPALPQPRCGTDGRTGGPGQQARRRAGARGARHRRSSAVAAAAASHRAQLRSPITQRPGPASRTAARGRQERGRPVRGGDGAGGGGGGGGGGRGAARTRTGASQGCRRLTDPRRSPRSSARGRPRGTPPRARQPRVTSARPDVRD